MNPRWPIRTEQGADMLRKLFIGICLLILPSAVVAQERYLIAYAGFAGFQSPLWATKELGLLTKYGINADLILTPGSTRRNSFNAYRSFTNRTLLL